MGVFGKGGRVFGRTQKPGASVAKKVQPNVRAASTGASAAGTSPRAIWASNSEYLLADAGASQATNQFFATRVRSRIMGGKWLAVAPVFVGSYQTAQRSPFGTAITAAYTCSFVLELANGTQTTSYTSPNTGGSLFQGTFNGSVDGIVRPGDVVVGDWIYASDFGLSAFEWTDSTLLPWLRVAYSKTASTDNIGAQTFNEYNYPSNSHFAPCTSYANAKTLITTAGVSSYNSGNNFWGSTDSNFLPTCIGFIGIPLSGQKAVFFDGTSICDGDGSNGYRQGGVDPAGNTSKNDWLPGYPNHWAQDWNRNIPVLNFGLGASALFRQFSDNATDGSWSTGVEISRQRGNWARFMRWFDVFIAKDVHNDGTATASYADILKVFTNVAKAANPNLKIYGSYVPNGYVDISGSTVAYSTGLDVRWNAQVAMVTAGYWDGMLTTRESVNNLYPDLGAQVSSTTTASGTTTTLTDTTQNWLYGQWVNSWVGYGGEKKLISANTATTLTFAALSGATASGQPYTIEGNTSYDGTHPNTTGQLRMATNFDASIQAVCPIPKFVRTA